MTTSTTWTRSGRGPASLRPRRRVASPGLLAEMRFHWRGLWRALHPIPAGRPLPRPSRDL